MNRVLAQREIPSSARRLTERCREMKLPFWMWNQTAELIVEPTGWGDADKWLRAPLLRELIGRSRMGWRPDVQPEAVELMPSCWIIPVGPVSADPRGLVGVALAMGEGVADADLFPSICRSGGLSPDIAREAVRSLAINRKPDVVNHSRNLRWMHADLVDRDVHERTVGSFSSQLVETYEQMSMLYGLAELMSKLEDPQGFVHHVCELMHDTLEFDWTAVRFSSLTTLGRVLTNDLILCGQIPCSHTRFDRLAGEVTQAAAVTDRPSVLDPARHDLARLVGAEVFVNPLVCDDEVAGLLMAGNKGGRDPEISTVDMQLVSATADYVSEFIHNSALFNEQRIMFLGIVRALSATIDAKDRYTRGHSERVAHLASELALRTGMTEEQAERVRLAGILHDMGKIGVPEAVLLKPGRLSDSEFNAIKKHPTIGYNILKDIEPLQDVLPGVLYHHERWDGRGYPHGLAGTRIPLLGRVLAVADSFDAMSSDRAYRPRMARESVLMEMRRGAGTQWDSQLVDAFLTLDFKKYDGMLDRHAAQSSVAA